MTSLVTIKKILSMQWFHTFKYIRKFCFDSFISRQSSLFTERKMALLQNIPIKITLENVWAILDSVESDYEDNLADVREDLDTDFVVEDNEDKHEDQDEEDNSLDSPNNNQPHAIAHDFTSANDTNVPKKCPSKEKENTEKEIHWTKSTNYIKI